MEPSEEEMAAIMVAIELLWPRPALAAAAPAETPNRWRFSGRWWARDKKQRGKTWRGS